MDSIHHFTALPASDWRIFIWFFPLWVLINACRCGFIQVAKNSKSSEIVNDSPPRPPFSALN
ncbi:hypothetical protein J4730_26015 [Klebsiella pneumoniae]|uniref:Uncharacterized protein n=1 Tax=Klebsiella pneumoniae TaxID=573 RepID=A0A939NTG1_KLEPN|nr:hypothetical protein [Klebsiella pneumoniae]MBO2029375.1 hypothetical protein [Klebsiella pneumoniae]